MIDRLRISADINLNRIEDAIMQAVDTEEIDYICKEKINSKNNIKYFLELKMKKRIHEQILAEVLSNWIYEWYEIYLMKKMLKTEFFEDEFDKATVLKNVLTNRNQKSDKKRYFVKKITKYLKNENELIIDGFIRFRMPEYRRKIYITLCEAIEEYYIEKEYEDFIELLKEYIKYKPSQIDLLHIKTEFDGNFSFYDFTLNKIEIDIEKETAQNPIEIFLTNEDMLISVLIALSPKRIIWHNPDYVKNQNLFNTIQLIFQNKFSVCNCCHLCKE